MENSLKFLTENNECGKQDAGMASDNPFASQLSFARSRWTVNEDKGAELIGL